MNKIMTGLQLGCLMLAFGQYIGKEEHAAWILLVGNVVTLILVFIASWREWRAEQGVKPELPHLKTATGADLDRLGKMYGVRRISEHNRTESDNQYRRHIELVVRKS